MDLKGRLRNVSENEGCQNQAEGAWPCGRWPCSWKSTPDVFSATQPEILLKNDSGVMPTATTVPSLLPSSHWVLSFTPEPSNVLHKTDFCIYCGLFLCFLSGNTFIVCSVVVENMDGQKEKMKITIILPPTEKRLTFSYVSFQTCVYVCVFTETGYTHDYGIAFFT